MLYEALEIVREQVDNYLADQDITFSGVVLDNIAHFIDDPDNTAQSMDNSVVMTLVNMEEENTLRNKRNFEFVNGKQITKNTPVNLNLFLLFSCNLSNYAFSLRALAGIIEFFQGKKIFTHTNTVFSRTTEVMQAVKEFKFTIELYTPSFEEQNFIWGSLGGKSYPSALYKLNLVSLERGRKLGEKPLITTIAGQLNDIGL